MRDRGTLYASDDTGGITAVVILDNDELALEVDGEAWGNWHVSVVEIAVIGSNEFQLGLGEDVLRFIPDRRLDFAYTTVPAFELAKANAGKGFRGRRKVKKVARQMAAGATAPTSQTPDPDQATPNATPEPAVPSRSPESPAISQAANPVANPVTAPEVTEPTSPPNSTTGGPLVAAEAIDPAVAALSAAADSLAAATPEPPPPGEVVIDLRSAAVVPATAEPLPEPPTEVPASPDPAPVMSDSTPTRTAPTLVQSAETKTGMRLLDRVRQSRAEHIHDYTVSSSGVMVRRVCRECNHVSIGTSD